MDFKLIRIDDRLIHGQVALGWSRSKGIDCILAVDDETAKNSFQCSLLKMATPSGVTSYILDKEKAVEKIQSGKLDHKKVMLLVKGPQTILDLYEMGVDIKEVNVGNLRSSNGKKLLSYVYATDDEIAIWKKLRECDIRFYAQSLPDQTVNDFNQIMDTL